MSEIRRKNRIKKDLCRRISLLTNLGEPSVEKVLNAFFDDCMEQVYLYGEFDLLAFGRFWLKKRPPRIKTIPKLDGTLEEKLIEYSIVKFTPSIKFKDVVNGREKLKGYEARTTKKRYKKKSTTEKMKRNYGTEDFVVADRMAFLENMRKKGV